MPTKKHVQEYSAEFKTQAVQLAITSGKSRRVVANELGMGMSTLSKWVKQHHRNPNVVQTISPISGLTAQQTLEQENRRLKRELEIVRQERVVSCPSNMYLLAADYSTLRACGADGRGRLKAATKFFAKENQ